MRQICIFAKNGLILLKIKSIKFASMKKLTSLFVMLLVSMSAFALARTTNKIVIPDVEGYKTLKGEFHIHTIFSDGSVWPETRVREAAWEGLVLVQRRALGGSTW